MIGFIVGILLFFAAVAGFGVAVYFSARKRKNKTYSLIGGIVGGVFALLLLLIPSSFHTVQAGEVAVVKHLGKAENVRTAGTYFDFWLTETYEIYDAKVQNLEISAQAYSKDAQTMDISMTVQYQINATKVIEIANKYGTNTVLENRIQSIATEKAKSNLSSYSAMEIIEKRSSISPQVEALIKETVDDEYCVDIVAVVLTNIDFSDAFEQTVEDKMIAEQEKLKAQYEKETAIINAEKELEVAKLAAEAQIEVSRAEARALQLKSVEVARALGFTILEKEVKDENDVVTSVEYTIDFTGKSADEVKLITEYLKYIEYLSKWDGKLPSVVTGDSATVMIPAPTDPTENTQN